MVRVLHKYQWILTPEGLEKCATAMPGNFLPIKDVEQKSGTMEEGAWDAMVSPPFKMDYLPAQLHIQKLLEHGTQI